MALLEIVSDIGVQSAAASERSPILCHPPEVVLLLSMSTAQLAPSPTATIAENSIVMLCRRLCTSSGAKGIKVWVQVKSARRSTCPCFVPARLRSGVG